MSSESQLAGAGQRESGACQTVGSGRWMHAGCVAPSRQGSWVWLRGFAGCRDQAPNQPTYPLACRCATPQLHQVTPGYTPKASRFARPDTNCCPMGRGGVTSACATLAWRPPTAKTKRKHASPLPRRRRPLGRHVSFAAAAGAPVGRRNRGGHGRRCCGVCYCGGRGGKPPIIIGGGGGSPPGGRGGKPPMPGGGGGAKPIGGGGGRPIPGGGGGMPGGAIGGGGSPPGGGGGGRPPGGGGTPGGAPLGLKCSCREKTLASGSLGLGVCVCLSVERRVYRSVYVAMGVCGGDVGVGTPGHTDCSGTRAQTRAGTAAGARRPAGGERRRARTSV